MPPDYPLQIHRCGGDGGRPILSVLIPALENRQARLQQLLYGFTRYLGCDLEVITATDSGQAPIGVKRNRLLQEAAGHYVAFVDDDDHLSDSYVPSILEEAKHNLDVISFQLWREDTKIIWNFRLGSHDSVVLHSNRQAGMTANHLCAWKRTIAVSVPFSPICYMDDVFWYRPLIAAGLARTERHIDQVLYDYLYNPAGTVAQQDDHRQRTIDWSRDGIMAYRHTGDNRIGVAVYDNLYQQNSIVVPVRFVGGVETVTRCSLQQLVVIYPR